MMAAQEKIAKTKDVDKLVHLSQTYHVLCDETALVGVLKQVGNSGQMIESELNFDRSDDDDRKF